MINQNQNVENFAFFGFSVLSLFNFHIFYIFHCHSGSYNKIQCSKYVIITYNFIVNMYTAFLRK